MGTVLVVGGGYAGVTAAQAAAARGSDVVLVDQTGRHELLPRLAQVAGGTAPIGDAWVPLAAVVGPRTTVVTDRVTRVDTEARHAVTATGTVIGYDAAVIAVGAVPSTPAIPGLEDHAWLCKTAHQAVELRQRIATAAALVIVGGGATGSQLAGEAIAAHPGLPITLVDAEADLLPGIAPTLARAARRQLEDAGVCVRTGTGLAEVDADGAVLADGTRIDGLVVWAGGFAASGHHLTPAAAHCNGRLVVDATGTVPGHGPLLAAGDAAAARGTDGAVLPQSAQVATRAGAAVGRNAARIAAGSTAEPIRLRHLGWVIPLGARRGVADLAGARVRGPGRLAVRALHDVIDARHLLELGGTALWRAHRPGAHRPAPAEVAALLAEPHHSAPTHRAGQVPPPVGWSLLRAVSASRSASLPVTRLLRRRRHHGGGHREAVRWWVPDREPAAPGSRRTGPGCVGLAV